MNSASALVNFDHTLSNEAFEDFINMDSLDHSITSDSPFMPTPADFNFAANLDFDFQLQSDSHSVNPLC